MSSLRTVRTRDPVWSVLSDPRGVSESSGPSAQFRSAQTLEVFDLKATPAMQKGRTGVLETRGRDITAR